MILRPSGVILGDGRLELGLEVVLEGDRIAEIRPHTGIPDRYVLSTAFVNAHSHLEYRGLMGAISASDYWPWIREITRLKREQSPEQVTADCRLAALENRAAGVGLIGEHTDRLGSAHALVEAGLDAVLFQELITFMEDEGALERKQLVREREERNAVAGFPIWISPHAFFTVDSATLQEIGRSGKPFSMHVAESRDESNQSLNGTGSIADFYREHGLADRTSGKRIVPTLADLGLVRPGAQFVHCCDLHASDIELLAQEGVSVAHCPRSNVALGCPPAPIREMLDAGIPVGLGLDSAASSGSIDMLAEMRAALANAASRDKPISAEEAWRMATSLGASSLPLQLGAWEIRQGARVPLIRIHVEGALETADLLDQATPDRIELVEATWREPALPTGRSQPRPASP